MKKLRYYFEYIVLAGLGFVVRQLPRKAIVFLGARVGDFIFYCIPIRKKLTIQQLTEAFPEKGLKEIKTIARDAYRNLVTNSIEHLCLAGMSKEEMLKIVKLENMDLLDKAIARNKGVIHVGGHFGNWEYMGSAVSMLGYPVAYVVAEINNPYINTMVNVHRQETGVTPIPKEEAVRGIMQTLKKKGTIAMLIDQDAGRNGIFLTFFDKICSTVRGPALFALKTGAAILFVANIRQPDGTIKAVFEEIEIDYDKGQTEENIREVMQSCTTMLESYIRKYPGHWFWMHRRWKIQPADLGLQVDESGFPVK